MRRHLCLKAAANAVCGEFTAAVCGAGVTPNAADYCSGNGLTGFRRARLWNGGQQGGRNSIFPALTGSFTTTAPWRHQHAAANALQTTLREVVAWLSCAAAVYRYG